LALLLSRIDSLTLRDHSYLAAEDECYYLREYFAGKGWKYGETNSLISNLKKNPLLKGTPQWRYKGRSISQTGAEMKAAINPKWLQGATIVPAPPSKARGDPLYDDRVFQIGRIICDGTGADLREVVVRKTSADALHTLPDRRDPEKLYEAMKVDGRYALPIPARIGILDDVVTTGATFRAVYRHLRELYPGASIVGFFVARRVPNEEDDQV
jgi:predicted amidophosphoribosyltransferase